MIKAKKREQKANPKFRPLGPYWLLAIWLLAVWSLVIWLLAFVSSPSALRLPPLIVINEIMSNPQNEDRGEFIELFNISDSPVDVSGWTISDSDAIDQIQAFKSKSAIIPPKGYALILDSEYDGIYEIPAGTALLTTKDTTIGNGLETNDPISLFDSSGEKLIDKFFHPFNAGDGISIERRNPFKEDTPDNWGKCADPTGSTPGRANSMLFIPPENLANRSDVRMNEVMYAPETKAKEVEWVELYNDSVFAADISGWRIEDLSGKSVAIPIGTLIPPKGYLIFTGNLEAFKSKHPSVNSIKIRLPRLLNSGGVLILKDNFGEEIDRVKYPEAGSAIGRSFERTDGRWRFSTNPSKSTPGAQNSFASIPSPNKPKIEASPNPFDPRLGPAKVRYSTPLDSKVAIKIFDSAGRLVKTLIENQEAGGEQEISWDATDRHNRRVKNGMYICHIAAIGDKKQPAATNAISIVVRER